MSNKLTSLAQLRQAALACQGLAADVAEAAAEAIGEVAGQLPELKQYTDDQIAARLGEVSALLDDINGEAV